MPLAGGEETRVIEDRIIARGFHVFSDGIYCLTGKCPHWEIRSHAFASRHSRKHLDFEGPHLFGLSVSPARKTFLFSRVVSGANLMMIENFG